MNENINYGDLIIIQHDRECFFLTKKINQVKPKKTLKERKKLYMYIYLQCNDEWHGAAKNSNRYPTGILSGCAL